MKVTRVLVRDRAKHPEIYGTQHAVQTAKTRLYVSRSPKLSAEITGDDFEAFYKAWPKLAREQVVPEALRQAGMEYALQHPVRWSRKAGCSCGCSPGFVLEGSNGYEVHVDVAADDE